MLIVRKLRFFSLCILTLFSGKDDINILNTYIIIFKRGRMQAHHSLSSKRGVHSHLVPGVSHQVVQWRWTVCNGRRSLVRMDCPENPQIISPDLVERQTTRQHLPENNAPTSRVNMMCKIHEEILLAPYLFLIIHIIHTY